jgi:hypothetical protein
LVAVAVWILTAAAAAGTLLAFWHLRATDTATRPSFAAGLAHGVVGTAGLGALLLSLRGPVRGVAAGVGSFGTMSAVLLAAAVLTGVFMLLLLPRRRKTIVMAIHGGLAVTGYVLLLAWNALG